MFPNSLPGASNGDSGREAIVNSKKNSEDISEWISESRQPNDTMLESASDPLHEPGWIPVGDGLSPHEKWFLPDAEIAAETPRFFKPVATARGLAIDRLRAAAIDRVEKALPKTVDELLFELRRRFESTQRNCSTAGLI